MHKILCIDNFSTKVMTQLLGYARISSKSQNISAQIDDLKRAGCAMIFTDEISGKARDRKGWNELTNYMRSGDILVISELSRMSRSLAHLLEIMEMLKQRSVELKSLRENIDTATATGRAFVAIMGAIAQMEIELKAERTQAGRAAAKARGKTGGRPRIDQNKLKQASFIYYNSDATAAEICDSFGFSRRSFFNYLRMQAKNIP
jgi:DNA invertase Pin-like site-specific DNA recombinase